LTPLAHLLAPCLLIVTACYIVRCVLSPWATCTRCHDRPRKRRNCLRCDGTGKRPRRAWRIAAYLIRTWKDSHR
jgi:hypothetical protein